MSEDILDRIHAHFRGQTFYEGRKPTLLEEAAAEIESLRAKLAEAQGAIRSVLSQLQLRGDDSPATGWGEYQPAIDAALARLESGEGEG